jgi:hypothetical protein
MFFFNTYTYVFFLKKKDLSGALSIAVAADIWKSCQNLANVAIIVCFINDE